MNQKNQSPLVRSETKILNSKNLVPELLVWHAQNFYAVSGGV